MEFEIDESPTRDQWDAVLNRSGEGDYRQTYEYGESVERSERRMGVARFLARTNEPVGVLQCIYGRRPLSRLLIGGSSGGGPTIVPLSGEDRKHIGVALLSAAEEFARRNLIDTARIHHFNHHGLIGTLKEDLGFHSIRETNIFFVRLSSDPKDVWDRMESPKRRNVRRALEKGVQIRVSNVETDVDLFHKMYVEFARTRGFEPFPRIHVESLWESFGPKNMIRVFVAEIDNQAVASALVLNHLDTAFCPYTCSTEEARQPRANDLLHWSIIEWASKSDLVRYNMGEVFSDPESSHYGLYKWKKGFGGYVDPMTIMERRFLPTFAGRLVRFAKARLKEE